MELVVKNIQGKDTKKKVSINDSIVGIEPNDHAIYLDVKQYLANKRQGTHKTKERGEVAGSTRKIKKQKGTGTARAGSIKSPVFVGGGRIFGPKPRNYGFKLNKKVKQLARKSALTYKLKSEGLLVIEDLNFEAPKTKQMAEIIKNFNLLNKKSLLVLPETNNNVYLSSRNLEGVKVVTISELNTYDIMNANGVLLSESSVEKLNNILG
jgi:large subunit ribosomal protein L4